ncbi:hypothetical protein [Streptomyces endophyticus]|uniref:Uncharacterized protein n=1 Tax=Streptomyces endophyticus TaxID=714166 RepID=A0ABU6F408_9ACTN|nr:hypothetical protein [Streptomyces endophyticus]MEB8338203.1 hypothetical protein [Streptomyces endophyticus]
MSNIVRAEELAELTDPYWLDSPVLGHGRTACECEDSEPSWGRAGALRLVLVGLASGLIVVGLAVALME